MLRVSFLDLALFNTFGGTGEGDKITGAGAGAGAGVPGSEASSGSGEMTGREGEGALLTVEGMSTGASLRSDSLVISMMSSGRGRAAARTSVWAARPSSSVTRRWSRGLDGGYGAGFLDLEPTLVRVARDTEGDTGASATLSSSGAPETEGREGASTSMITLPGLGRAASAR